MDLFSIKPDDDSPEAATPLSVAEACELIKTTLSGLNGARPLRVVGEIGEFRPRGGQSHWYFSLRDEDGSTLNCAFFSQRRMRSELDFEPEQGMVVVAEGTFDYYAPFGKLSFIVSKLMRRGVGPLHEQYERLRREFQEAGLFSQEQKLPLPEFPRRIAILTSPDGAVRHDIEMTARSRWQGIELVLIPIPVQGDTAAPRIARAIRAIRAAAPSMGVDAIILARGGGSLEDLWAFNTREVVEAIHESRIQAISRKGSIPLIAGIGHESDTTLADLVSDRRASTPTQAAMILVPSSSELTEYVQTRLGRMRILHRANTHRAKARLAAALKHPVMRRAETMLQPHRRRMDSARTSLHAAAHQRIVASREGLAELERRLAAASPAASVASARARLMQQKTRLLRELKVRLDTLSRATEARARHLAAIGPGQVLARGYSITLDPSGRPIRDASQVEAGTDIRSRFSGSELPSRVLTDHEKAALNAGE